MTPNPVHIPRGEVRELRRLLAQRGALIEDRKRWQLRARAHLRARGMVVARGKDHIQRQIEWMTSHPEGVEPGLLSALGTCQHAMDLFDEELVHIDAMLDARTRDNAIIQRLRTIPGIGQLVAIHLYAAIDDIRRFPNSSSLSSYAGLVPSVRQTGMAAHYGKITKEGSPELRRVLVQAAHAVHKLKAVPADFVQAIVIAGARVEQHRFPPSPAADEFVVDPVGHPLLPLCIGCPV
jgi:transposase